MDESHVHDIARVIQLALAPAFLLTAIGSLLNVFANRLARIVDRSRALERGAPPEGDQAIEAGVLKRRGHLVRWSITLGTGAALFVTLVIGIAFLGFLLRINFAFLVAGLFLREVTLAIGTFDQLLRVGRRPRRDDAHDDARLGGA
jgi:hypothetical protein